MTNKTLDELLVMAAHLIFQALPPNMGEKEWNNARTEWFLEFHDWLEDNKSE